MPTDQVERLTQEVPASDTGRMPDSLPLQTRDTKPIMDLIAQDRDDLTSGESPIVQTVLSGLTWTVYALALGAVAMLIRTMADGFLAHK